MLSPFFLSLSLSIANRIRDNGENSRETAEDVERRLRSYCDPSFSRGIDSGTFGIRLINSYLVTASCPDSWRIAAAAE
jgi:hypothetical protein